MSARSVVTPGGSGRSVLRPRFSTNKSMPCATATRAHAELMTPVPPMNNTLRLATPQRQPAAAAGRGTGRARPMSRVLLRREAEVVQADVGRITCRAGDKLQVDVVGAGDGG